MLRFVRSHALDVALVLVSGGCCLAAALLAYRVLAASLALLGPAVAGTLTFAARGDTARRLGPPRRTTP